MRLSTDALTAAVATASTLPPVWLTYRSDLRCWQIERTYAYEHDSHELRVPEGFQFDLASIPRPLWGLIAPFELSIAAPLLHDYLYRCGGRTPSQAYTRAEADRIFLDVMRREGVSRWRRGLAYSAVRVFGGASWRAQ